MGLEPTTSTLRVRRATHSATAAYCHIDHVGYTPKLWQSTHVIHNAIFNIVFNGVLTYSIFILEISRF